MTNDNFERLNLLADKALSETMTSNELKEFSKLLNMWNESTELTSFRRPSHISTIT